MARGQRMRKIWTMLVVLCAGLVATPAPAQTFNVDPMFVDDVTHLGGDRWRATGRAEDSDCRPPHRLGVLEATGSQPPDDVGSARTIERVQGAWTVEFVDSSDGIYVVLFCDEIHVNREVLRSMTRGTREQAQIEPPEAPREAPQPTGTPVGLVVGGATAAAAAAFAAALALRTRRRPRRDSGHAACVTRHEVASDGVTAAKARVRGLSGIETLNALDAELRAARRSFDDLLGERATVEALVDEYVRSAR